MSYIKKIRQSTMKNVVLIRHGQSLGQTARVHGISRKDPSLTDCFLSSRGIQQASQLRSNEVLNRYDFDLVCTSPLSRALSTCILAQGHIIQKDMQAKTNTDPVEHSPRTIRTTSFLACPDICEFGKGIPENHGRPLAVLRKDLKKKLSVISSPSTAQCIDYIDYSTMPLSWPENDNNSFDHKLRVRSFLNWLSNRTEVNVAVVCHYNVIKWMLNNSIERVPNCRPIECVLTNDGELYLKSTYNGPNFKNQIQQEKNETRKNHNRKSKKNKRNDKI